MHTLPAPAQDACDALAAAPRTILRLHLPSGVRHYAEAQEFADAHPAASDEPADPGTNGSTSGFTLDGTLILCGPVALGLDEAGVLGRQSALLRVSDPAGELLSPLAAGEFDNARVEILQAFANLPVELAFVLLAGRILERPRWLEGERLLELRVAGELDCTYSRWPLRRAARAEFAQIPPQQEGRILPFCRGQVERVEAVCVAAAPEATLLSRVAADSTELYVDDATPFPLGEIQLRIKDEIVRGEFSGNRFVIAARADFLTGGSFGPPAGNAFTFNTTGLDPDDLPLLPGLELRANVAGKDQTTYIHAADPDGTLRVRSTFGDAINGADIKPPEGGIFTIHSRLQNHYPGARVSLFRADSWYVFSDAPGAREIIVEGENAEGFARIEEKYIELFPAGDAQFPGAPCALLRLRVPPTRQPRAPMQYSVSATTQPPFRSDRVFVSFAAGADSGAPDENPVNIIRDVLVQRLHLAPELIDAESFALAALARGDTRFSFVLTEPFSGERLLRELCMQARLALVAQRGLARLIPLENGLAQEAHSLAAAQVAAGTLAISGESAQGVDAVSGEYQGGGLSLSVEGAPGIESRRLPLWAFSSRFMAARVAGWWLRRWRHPWRELSLTTFLPGAGIDCLDTVRLHLPEATLLNGGDAQTEIVGVVRGVERLGRAAPEQPEAYRLRLECPRWEGCLASCQSSCETGGCESGGCESSCTVTCEIDCQNACQVSLQPVLPYSSYSCKRTCQVSCRAAGESGCASSGCESACESGCEISCEAEACESSCESARESVPEPDLLRRVIVLSPPSTPGGAAQVRNLGGEEEEFSALDISDLRPAANEECAALRLLDGAWVLGSAARAAKLVRVVADLGGGAYSVVESGPGGDWGASFTAYKPQ